MAIVDRHGLPVAVHVASASQYEPHLVPATLDARFFADLLTRLIDDRGYDSDRLDDTLMTTYGIEMIAAHRRGRARTQDGRPLRRVRRRWKVERFFAWLHHSRRAVTRWEYHVDNFLGMIQLACARMLLRAFMKSVLARLSSVRPAWTGLRRPDSRIQAATEKRLPASGRGLIHATPQGVPTSSD
jgi:transposase